jgi:hypothetical protein
VWRVTDRWGNVVELTDERWSYISYWHPDLADHLDEVLKTIREGKRRQDVIDLEKFVYYRKTDVLLPDYNHILVVIRLIRNNFVVTAYPKTIGE